jgi:hypothetical protein
MTIDSVFADANDFELCDAVTSAIEDRYGFYDLLERHPDIPTDRWAAHAVWGNTGFFECEGYSRFWGSETDQAGFAEAIRMIGFPILADILENAILAVPKNILGNHDAVETHVESERIRMELAEQLDSKLISERPDITGKPATFIRYRRASYADLIEQIETVLIQSRKLRGV